MSEEKKAENPNPEVGKKPEEKPAERVIVELDQSPAVKTLTDEVTRLKGELATIQTKKEEMVAEGLKTKEERDNYKTLLEEYASKAFETEKTVVKTELKKSGYLTDEQLNAQMDGIKTPEDLEKVKAFAKMFIDGMNTASVAQKFESDKTLLLTKFPDAKDKISAITKPEELETVKEDLEKSTQPPAKPETSPPATPAPTGKAEIPLIPDKYIDIKAIVDNIYGTLADPNASMKDKQEAEEKRKQLWQATRKGLVATLEKHKTHPRYTISQCPKCGNFMMGDKCDVCGYLQG